jgi:hypothetical protein
MAVALGAAAAAVSGAAPASAAPLPRAEICVARATVYDTPGGMAVGVLARGTNIVVVRRGANRRWVRVRSAHPITGWTRAKALCD